jgi:ribose transport system permease protein
MAAAMKTARRLFASEWTGLALIALLGAIALSALNGSFLTEFNVYVLLRSGCVTLLVAFAQMTVLATGQMNLSVGALGGLVAVLFGGMIEVLGIPLPVALVVALAIGAAGGWINGVLTTRTGISGFVITLATASIFTGINYGLTRAVPFYRMPPELVAFGDTHWGFVPALMLPLLVVAPLLALFFHRVPTGRRLLALGGNPVAAALSGISADRMIVIAHVLSGTLVGTAALLSVAQLGSAQPLIGSDWLLLSFAAPIVGGTALTGGSVSILGATFAVLVIALIQNGMVLAKVDPYWVQFLLGALILLTVGLNRWRAVRLGGGA